MSIFKKFAKETLAYGLSSIIGRLLNYLLVPFYTTILMPADYGILTECYAYAAFFNILYTYGMETAYFRFASKNPNNEKGYRNIISSALLVSSLLFSSLLIFFSSSIAQYLNYPTTHGIYYVYYFAAIFFIDAILVIPFAQLRLQKKAVKFSMIKIVHITITIFFNIFFLYFLEKYPCTILLYNSKYHVDYIFISNLIANSILLWVFSRTLCKIKFTLPWKKLKKILHYAYPLLLVGLAGTTNEMFSRAMLKYLLPDNFYSLQTKATILGVFGACYKLSIFMLLGIQAFRYAAEPFFFSKAKDNNAPLIFSQLMHGYILIACCIFFTVSVNLDLISQIFLRNALYREGVAIVPYLLLAYLFWGVYYNLSACFKLADKTHYSTYITIIGAAITIVMNMLLIPILGYWGSIWATLSSYIIMVIIAYYYGQRCYPIPYYIKKKLLYIILTVILSLSIPKITFILPYSTIIFRLACTILFIAMLYIIERKSFYQNDQ